MKRIALAVLALSVAGLFGTARAAEPGYPHGKFTGDCATCHDPDHWTPARIARDFRHKDTFPLRGAHKSATCRSCHLSLDFGSVPTACADCHKDIHRGELGTDCARCHTPVNFIDRTKQLENHRSTRFPLTGAHVTQDCESCHPSQPQGALTWVGTPIDCQSCHLALYQATTNPNHAAAGFPLDCSMCHTPTAWDRAAFDHAGTNFPLTGAHRTVPCASCHANGYAGTPTDCYSCHANDYNNAGNPNHIASGFPTDCKLCHTTTAFQPASFKQHDSLYFPIYSGSHQGRWSACSDCHTQANNFASFSCFLCHSQASMNSRHQGINGYAYDSNLCYQCHPNGRAG
jgi:hypothetical protein